MGQSPEDARRGVRFSLGATTTAAEVDAALAALAQVLPRLQPRRAAPTVPPPP
jgi:cysteine desulfurase